MRAWVRVSVVVALVLGELLSPASQARAAEPPFIPWPELLPGLSDEYVPSSENICVSGKIRCIDSVISEMERRFEPQGRSCHHNSMFSLAYLRTTQTYRWASAQPGFFREAPWVNHEAAVFAKYYFRAYDAWAAGRPQDAPAAWRIAFDAAQSKRVSGSGDMMLGMSAHINRDLPIALAAIGIFTPDGQSRKEDHDRVDRFLNLVMEPMLKEAAARFDKDVLDIRTPFGVGYTALFQQVATWRELAWRNAELLVNAPTPALRAAVLLQIETNAEAQARAIVAGFSYLPPVTTTGPRDTYCAANNGAAAPMPYAFGTPSAY